MVEELLIELFMPFVMIIPRSEANNIENLLWEIAQIEDYKITCWLNDPGPIMVNKACDILPTLNKLLRKPFDTTVFLLTDDSFDSLIKSSLNLIVEHYEKICKRRRRLWLLNTTEGYAIEDTGYGIFIGLIPKQPDPYSRITMLKDPSPLKYLSLQRFFLKYIKTFGVNVMLEVIFGDRAANKILSFYQSKFPFTPAGKIDWDKIEKKIAVGRDPGKIIPALEQLLEKPVSMTAYINWCDAGLPLVKVDLRDAIVRYNQIIAVARETVIFNPTARYVIEINGLGGITVGVLEGKT